jgi:hypothetical protein
MRIKKDPGKRDDGNCVRWWSDDRESILMLQGECVRTWESGVEEGLLIFAPRVIIFEG